MRIGGVRIGGVNRFGQLSSALSGFRDNVRHKYVIDIYLSPFPRCLYIDSWYQTAIFSKDLVYQLRRCEFSLHLVCGKQPTHSTDQTSS